MSGHYVLMDHADLVDRSQACAGLNGSFQEIFDGQSVTGGLIQIRPGM